MARSYLLLIFMVLFGCGKPDRIVPAAQPMGVFDPTAMGPRQAPPNSPLPPIEVVDYGPRAGEVGAQGIGQIYVRFNRPVVPLTDAAAQGAGDRLVVHAAGRLVEGRAYWQTPDRLVFESKAALGPAQRYDIRFKGRDDVAGIEWSFATARPDLELIEPIRGASQVGRTDPIFVRATLATTLAELQRTLRLQQNGEAMSATLELVGNEEAQELGMYAGGTLVRIVHPTFDVGAKIRVVGPAGWTSNVGSLPATKTLQAEFDVHPKLSVTTVTCEANKSCGLQPITVEFSTLVHADQKSKITVTPRPPLFEIQKPWNKETDNFVIEGRFVPGTTYTLKVSRNLTDIFGQKLGADSTRALRFAMPPAELYLTRSEGGIVDDGTARLGISSRHIETVRIRVAKISPDRYRELHFADKLRHDQLPPLDSLGEVVEVVRDIQFSKPTEWASTPLLIEEIVGDFRGPVAVDIAAVKGAPGYDHNAWDDVASEQHSDRGIYYLGSLAPHVFTSISKSVLRVEDLSTRTPRPGLKAELYRQNSSTPLGTTDSDGLLIFEHAWQTRERDDLLMVRDPNSGESGAVGLWPLPPVSAASWLRPGERVTGKLLAERGVYRPGEEVYVTGWAAVRTPHDPYGHTSLPHTVRARVEVMDRDGVQLDRRVVDVRNGRFWTKLQLPKAGKLGSILLRATFLDGKKAATNPLTTDARIEEFRVPDFEVSATPSAAEIVGDQAVEVEVRSRYLSGTPAKIEKLQLARRCWHEDPPEVTGWRLGLESYRRYGSTGTHGVPAQMHGEGRATISLKSLADPDGGTRRCSVSATVQNPSFQEETSTASILVHPATTYLGVRQPAADLKQGDDLELQYTTFDLDLREVSAKGTIDVEVKRTYYVEKRAGRGARRWTHRWEEETETVRRCKLARASKTARCAVRNLKAGRYEISAAVRGVPVMKSRISVHISEYDYGEDRPAVTIDAPKQKLTPGAMTEVIIRSERDGSGVLLLERFGIRDAIPFKTKRRRATVRLPTDLSWVPEMMVRAAMVDYDGATPTLAEGTHLLTFDTKSRDLHVSVKTPETGGAGQSVSLEVEVSDAAGPVSGQATVWAVDDAVLALTKYRVPKIAEAFYPGWLDDVKAFDRLGQLLGPFKAERWDPYTAVLSGTGFGSGGGFGRGGGGVGASGPGPNQPRSDFRTTPLFLGDVDVEDGTARLDFDLPDNMTRFRVFAVVSATLHDDRTPLRFGVGQSTISVQAPLVARPALPRFVRPSDQPELAVVVENASEKDGQLEVSMKLDGTAIEWAPGTDAVTTQLLAAGEQTRVGFLARVIGVGEVDVTISTVLTPSDGSPPVRDSVRSSLESTAEPTVVETVAMYGTIDDDVPISIPVMLPGGVRTDYGGIEVGLHSTILGGLQDATRELIHYPYGCAEQTASRMLPLVAMADLKHFVDAVELPAGVKIDAFVASGVDRLLGMQRSDGGFGYWPGSSDSHPYVSAYVTWVLQLAAAAGHPVPEQRMANAYGYLNSVTNSPDKDWPDSVLYYHDIRRAIAVHVLATAGLAPNKAVDELLVRVAKLPAFARAFVVAAVATMKADDPRLPDLQRQLTNLITETPSSAHVVESVPYDLGALFHSDLRSSAIVMMALTRSDPDHPVIVKLARGLMEKRYRGSWRNTQENAYALVALAEYARVYEKDEPNFGVKVWVDNALLLDDRWVGRSSKTRAARLPIAEALNLSAKTPTATLPINVHRQGVGRAYYRLAMRYAPSATDLPPIARGLQLKRTFRPASGEAQTTVPKRVVAGEVIAIDVEIVSKALTRYVAIDLPLPAGFEGIDLTLGSAKMPMNGAWGWWLNHREYHDDRILLFADTLHPGSHTVTVYVRATTPGLFVFPPATAQAMYTPEVFGRTDGGTTEVARRQKRD